MSFDQAFALTVGVEGGYQCSTADPGNWWVDDAGSHHLIGTNWGISAPVLADWLGRPITQTDMQTLTRDQAAAIYRARYWEPLQADALPAPIAALLFDGAVNQGVGRAAHWLQNALGVAADGIVGPVTLAAVAAADAWALHAEIARRRDESYRLDAAWARNAVGWIRRLMTVVAASARLA